MLKYFINILIILTSLSAFSQDAGAVAKKDSVPKVYKDRYGLRVGIDLYNPINSLFNEERKGLEFVGDYRISKRFFIAAELGYLEYKGTEDFFSFTTNGQYIKAGGDFNAYKNWIGMENMIYVGLRYAFSTFDQTLNEYTINADPFLLEQNVPAGTKYDNLTASWIEFVIGMKVEVLHNVFLGFSFRGNQMITSKEPDNFKCTVASGNVVFTKQGG